MAKRQNNILQWGIPSVLLIVFLIGTLFTYYSGMQKNVKDSVIEYLQNQGENITKYYENSLTNIMESVTIAADFCSREANLYSNNNLSLLRAIKKNSEVKDAIIVNMEDKAMDAEGEGINYHKYLRNSNGNLDLLSGKTVVSHVFEIDKNEYGLVLAEPIKTDTEMRGIILLIIEPMELSKVVKRTTYLSTNSYYTITKDGTITQQYGPEIRSYDVGKNFFTELKKMTFIEGSETGILTQIEKKKNGVIKVKINDEVKNILYEPLATSDSYLLMMVSENQFEKSIDQRIRKTRSMVFMISLYIVLFVVVVIAINAANRAKFVRQNKELQNQAETDLLTELYNKVSTERKIKEYMEGEGANHKSVMFVLDIDNFKRINDTMGHAFGDEVIRTLGKQLKAEFRINDIIGRTGGDEFIILLKDMKNEEIIMKEANRLVTFFKNFQVGEYTKYYATASIGAAVYPRDGEDFESLYKSADQALYEAKRRGKNQMAFFKDKDKAPV